MTSRHAGLPPGSEKTPTDQTMAAIIRGLWPSEHTAADALFTAMGTIPVSPKYGSGDFARTEYWRHRGGTRYQLPWPGSSYVHVRFRT